jgi:hypothetical protein
MKKLIPLVASVVVATALYFAFPGLRQDPDAPPACSRVASLPHAAVSS